MGRARFLVEAMVVEGRSPTELARAHGVARSWLYKLLSRFREGGYQALEPRSRRPHNPPLSRWRTCSSNSTPSATTTTSVDPTAPSAARLPSRSSAPRSRPRLPQPRRRPTTESAVTASSRTAAGPRARLFRPRRPMARPQCPATGVLDVLRQDKGGANGIRTHDLLRAREALSQLSYRPARQYTGGFPAGPTAGRG